MGADPTHPVLFKLARRLLGKPLPRSQSDSERLPSFEALPILSSDALSSVAYATEAALGVLILAGSRALELSLPITWACATARHSPYSTTTTGTVHLPM